jgi:hypothetical protein
VIVLTYCRVFSIFHSVSSVMGYLFVLCSVRGCLLQGWCVDGSCCRIAPICEDKEEFLVRGSVGAVRRTVYMEFTLKFTYLWEHVI